MRVQGWIFDTYIVPMGMCVWIIDGRGRMFQTFDPWQPRLFVKPCSALKRFLSRNRIPVSTRTVERKDFFSNAPLIVEEIRVRNPLSYKKFVLEIEKDAALELFNCDIDLGQAHHFERQTYPLARGEFEIDGENVLRAWSLRDSAWDIEYELPPLRYASLGLESHLDPNHAKKGTLVLSLNEQLGTGTSYLLESTDPEEMLETLNNHIAEWDPDVLLTRWGDSYILPRLQELSRRTGIPLKLSRDPERSMVGLPAKSFFTYGRTIYQGGGHSLFGRWHLDMKNSFTLVEAGLDGLYEVSRIAKLPIQRAARCTIGAKLSSMQMDCAEREGYLIPIHKQQMEDFREGLSFVAADKGGLVYEPEVGWHGDIGGLDYESMYPRIMDIFNISPETVNCACCPDNLVPEIGHHICRHRRGLVPKVIKPLLEKRAVYKKLLKADPGGPQAASYKQRAEAIKWVDVCCFGYLGFKNSRYGKIEAHECVSAYGREILLKAKDIAEAAGYHFVHGIVDSLWVKRPGALPKDYETLAQAITVATGLPMKVEGIYKWICFCPTRGDAEIGVPNRYFGCFEEGKLKIRGIEIRRSDTPNVFKEFQGELLECLRAAHNVAECRSLIPALQAIYAHYQEKIRDARVSFEDLAYTSTLTKLPEEYVHDTYSSIAARQLAASGVELHAGEEIQWIICAAKEKVKDWRVMPLALALNYGNYDVTKYLELLERVYLTIVEGFGITAQAKSRKKARPALSPQLTFTFSAF